MGSAGGGTGVGTRALGAWIGVALIAAGVSALRLDSRDEVSTAGGPSPAGPFSVDDRDEPRLSPAATTTTIAPTTTTTLATTAPAVKPPATAARPVTADALMIDRPGLWIVRADGSEARFVGDAGTGGPRGYGAFWSPDSSALLGLSSRDGVHSQLLRTGLDGSRTWYALPPSPPINDELGPARRWITDLEVSGDRIAFGWMRDDGYAGAAVATIDLSHVLVEFDDDHYCCHPIGNRDGTRFAFTTGDGIEVLDLAGRRVAGPFQLAPRGDGPEVSEGVGAFSPDGRHALAGVDDRTCILDLSSGDCPTISFDNHPSIAWMGSRTDLLMEVFRGGGSTTSLYVRKPGSGPRLLTSYGSYGVPSPSGTAVVFGRSPYEYEQAGVASVHMINADGTGEHLLAETRNAVAFPWGWSPDGKWIAVHVGGPR